MTKEEWRLLNKDRFVLFETKNKEVKMAKFVCFNSNKSKCLIKIDDKRLWKGRISLKLIPLFAEF